MNAVYAAAAWPVGALSDRAGTTGLLGLGLALLVLADIVLAFAPGLGGVAVGVLVWGLHMGFSQGLLSALVAGAVPPELRGTAFGLFNLVTGVALLLASVIAGALWEIFGAQWTFLAGAGFAVLAGVALVPLARGTRPPQARE
jgi:MFS family permease